MAKKPAPTSGATAKHAAATKPAASTKHATTTTAKKPTAKHAAAKPALSPQTQALIKQDVATLVKQQVQKTLASMGIKPATKKPAPKTAAKKPAAKPAAKGTAARGYTPGGLAVCVVEGLAESLRMAGKPVGADDVLTLFHLADGDPDDGLSILAALVTAQHAGLAGAYPVFRPAGSLETGTVLGLTIPAGPHTVVLDGGGVRTWGEWVPARASLADRIEEAWEVSWH